MMFKARRIAANAKKLFTLHNREAGDAAKVAKKTKKASDAAAKIARQKNTKKTQLAATKAANQWQLHQSTAETLRKQAEESSSAWAAAQVIVKQLQDAAKKTSDLPDLPDSLQEDQEDDYISNITNNKSLDKEAKLISGG